MISLVEVQKTSTEDLPQIYCDMDGVLCDFIRGANKAVNGLFVTADRNTRWDKIIAGGSKYWADLEWMSGGKKLYQFIARYNPKILSDCVSYLSFNTDFSTLSFFLDIIITLIIYKIY